jgi:hypothetical protein
MLRSAAIMEIFTESAVIPTVEVFATVVAPPPPAVFPVVDVLLLVGLVQAASEVTIARSTNGALRRIT